MAEDQEETAIRTVLQENQRLKKRLFDLEEKIRKGTPPSEGQSGSGSSVLKLIEHKDFQLEQARARLEEKKEQFEEATRDLRLYREIFETDPTAMIGVNREGMIILHNRAASQLLGQMLQESLRKPVESLDFRAVDPDTAKRVQQALSSRKPADSSVVVRDRRILTSVHPIGSESEPRGALIRIQVGSAK
jgi:PAS domain S-box-containing protein